MGTPSNVKDAASKLTGT